MKTGHSFYKGGSTIFNGSYMSDQLLIEVKRVKNCLIAIGLVVATCAALPAFGKPKNDKAVAKSEKQICRVFLNTGSRLNTTKICKTETEWAEDQGENAKVLREKRGNQGGPQLGNGG